MPDLRITAPVLDPTAQAPLIHFCRIPNSLHLPKALIEPRLRQLPNIAPNSLTARHDGTNQAWAMTGAAVAPENSTVTTVMSSCCPKA